MSTPFDPTTGLVQITVVIEGPTGRAVVRAGLDTGSERTLIDLDTLISVGYDPQTAKKRKRITTASGIVNVPIFTVKRIQALDAEQTDAEVIGHTLPPSSSVQGLLGLTFFRGRVLNIDFQTGLIEVT